MEMAIGYINWISNFSESVHQKSIDLSSETAGIKVRRSTTVDVLSWKLPPRPHSMLEIPTQSMDTNFYNNIELGGREGFFPTLESRVVVSPYSIFSRTFLCYLEVVNIALELIGKIIITGKLTCDWLRICHFIVNF